MKKNSSGFKNSTDFQFLGEWIYDRSFDLSRRVNHEILEPMSEWLDDPDWMNRFAIYEHDAPNWAEYKRRQREWTAKRKQMLADRMKAYWQEIRRRRNFRKDSFIYNTKQ